MANRTILIATEVVVDEYKNLDGKESNNQCGNCGWHNTQDEDTDWWSCSLFGGSTNGCDRVKECLEAEELFLAQIRIH